MKLLLCSQIPKLDHRLGAARVVLDFAEAWRSKGWECDLFPDNALKYSSEEYPIALHEYLIKNANRYDVIDFPYNAIPWATSDHKNVLKVARSVLLAEHCYFQPNPKPPFSIRAILSNCLKPIKARSRRRTRNKKQTYCAKNLEQADLINVGNSADLECLVKLKIPREKVIVFPYGLTKMQRNALETVPLSKAGSTTIAFLGTFDYRKGCMDFPEIFRTILESHPNVRFRLIGTRGMFVTKEEVLQFFPKTIRKSIEVVPEFEPSDLAHILSDCHFGLFPSYWEGFGIGVVEMLATGLPTIAYNVPGPCDILPEDWLVERGDVSQLAAKLLTLIQYSPEERLLASERAREHSQKFDWTEIACKTHEYYLKMLNRTRC